jgi:hypothetical protein
MASQLSPSRCVTVLAPASLTLPEIIGHHWHHIRDLYEFPITIGDDNRIKSDVPANRTKSFE